MTAGIYMLLLSFLLVCFCHLCSQRILHLQIHIDTIDNKEFLGMNNSILQ